MARPPRLVTPAAILLGGLLACGGGSSAPRSCQVDADCGPAAVCNAGACQARLTLTIVSPTVAGTPAFVNGTVTVKVTVSGGQPAAVDLQLDGSHLTSIAPPDYQFSWDTRTVGEGNHQLKATVTLGGTTTSSAAVDVIVKRTAPVTPTLVVTSPTNAQPVPVSGTADVGTLIKILDGTTPAGSDVTTTAAGTWSTTLALAEGSHALSATATDQAGNVSAASAVVTVLVDRTAPAAPTIAPIPSPSNLPSIAASGTAEAGSTLVVRSNGVEVGRVSPVPADGTWSLALALPNGQDSLTAIATDAAGNASPPSAPVLVAVDRTQTTVPIIVPLAGPTHAQPVPLTGSAPPSTTVKIYEGTTPTGTPVATTTADAGGGWSVGVPLTEGSHTLVATATNAAGTVSSASTPVTVVVDRTPPTVSARTPSPGEPSFLLASPIQVTFSEAMAPASFTSANFRLIGAMGSAPPAEIPTTATSSADGKTWTLAPATRLVVTGADAVALSVSMTTGLQDLAGNPLQLPGGDWSFTAPAFLPVGALGAPSAVIGGMGWGSQGTLWVATVEPPAPAKAMVRKWDGSSWSTQGPFNNPARAAQEACLAVTPAGDPFLAWTELVGNVAQVFVRKLTSGSTTMGPLNHTATKSASGPAIVTDAGGAPVVAWYETTPTASDTEVVVMRLAGGSWALVGNATISANVAPPQPVQQTPNNSIPWRLSVSMNGSSPVVAYQSRNSGTTPGGYSVRVSSSDGGTGSWMPVGDRPNPQIDSVQPSLAMDGSHPVVTFLEKGACVTCPGMVQIMRHNGTAWSTLGANYLNRDSSHVAAQPWIAVRGADDYLVTWQESPTPATTIHVSNWNGAAWLELEHLQLNHGGGAFSPFLAVDGGGVPAVGWSEASGGVSRLYVDRENR